MASRLAHANRSGGSQPGDTLQKSYKQNVFNGLCMDLGVHI